MTAFGVARDLLKPKTFLFETALVIGNSKISEISDSLGVILPYL